MAFQTPITIEAVINKIQSNKYLLPAIQREFVWSSEQIEWLFDSIMQDYSISSFHFWEVKERTAEGYRFYKFLNHYRERYKIHNEEISTNGIRSFYSILDGQQRLTALFLGLKGSYAYKEYRKQWQDNESSLPTRHLYINITNVIQDEDGRMYEFLFLNKKDTGEKELYVDSKRQKWFKVGCILNYKNDTKFNKLLEKCHENNFSKKTLKKLRDVICYKALIHFFLEKSQDLNKVLNMFIRTNSGGEPLSFSDLMMSIAVANWKDKDARNEIHNLVDAIQEKGFLISKDLILKTFLYLHSKDIKFKVTNFSKENAKDFELQWEKLRDAILETFELIKSFGFHDYSLTSKNAILPIIYYIYHKDIYKDFSKKVKFKKDRDIIKKWLHSVLIKRIFGGSSDTTLSQFRQTFTDDVIQTPMKDEIENFPMEFKNVRNISIDDKFIEGILWTRKNDKYAFSILALLYPYLDYKNNNFHKDHIHPENLFNELSEDDKRKYEWKGYDSIHNLQLLDANDNTSKQDQSLEDWVNQNSTKKGRKDFLKKHLIPDIDLSINNFSEFFTKRKDILVRELKKLLI